MKHKIPFILIAVALCATVLTIPTPSPTDAPSEGALSGLRVTVDPATGRIANDGTSKVADVSGPNLFTTSGEDLEVIPSPVEGGGIMIDLQGRFMNAHIATVDESGERSVECIEQAPASTLATDE